MWHAPIYFLLGMATPVVVEKAAPTARELSGRAYRAATRRATRMREDLQDLFAEAAAELDEEEGS